VKFEKTLNGDLFMTTNYVPVFELTRGKTIESVHHGCIAVVDVYGKLLAWYGDADTVTFLRSSAKPFQALPFVERGGVDAFHLSQKELAILCASHSGTDDHVATVRGIQAKAGISEAELLCGVHDPGDEATLEALRERKEKPTPVRHNCSGKHTGMLAYTRLSGTAKSGLDYIDPQHPIQKVILQTFAEMCDFPADQIGKGTDGCSAPNFAIPLRNAALGFARLCDPLAGGVKPPERVAACQAITRAMTSHPDMVGGPGRFDTRLMEVGQGRIVAKGGAEGYQAVGLAPGLLGPGSPAVGIALKIADGDARGKARTAVALEVLRQLGALSQGQQDALADMGPEFPIYNWRKIHVGQAYPIFTLKREETELEFVKTDAR
jgi:L-asparaginase II